MKIAFIIFDGITWLDFIGIYDPISRLRSMEIIKDISWDTCAFTPSAKDNFGLEMVAGKIREPLTPYDVLIVPGGYGTRKLQFDQEFLSWIKTAEQVEYKISICTGSLILGAAGFLKDKLATTHFSEYKTLEPYCRKVLQQRIVEDGNVITAGAVTSSIDLGLFLCSKWAGKTAAGEIRKRMDYHG
jgi:transcriptional regulator GlxA family with amidase domain